MFWEWISVSDLVSGSIQMEECIQATYVSTVCWRLNTCKNLYTTHSSLAKTGLWSILWERISSPEPVHVTDLILNKKTKRGIQVAFECLLDVEDWMPLKIYVIPIHPLQNLNSKAYSEGEFQSRNRCHSSFSMEGGTKTPYRCTLNLKTEFLSQSMLSPFIPCKILAPKHVQRLNLKPRTCIF